MTKEEIFDKLKEIFISEFELDESKITMDALVFEDLDYIDGLGANYNDIYRFINVRVSK